MSLQVSFHAPALPAGVEPDVMDAAAEAAAARRRAVIETTLTAIATFVAVLLVSVVSVALELVG
jgi:hypothetical protein